MDEDLKGSVDFDFFEQDPGTSRNDDSAHTASHSIASIPPKYPRPSKPSHSHSEAISNKENKSSIQIGRSSSPSGSDSSSSSSGYTESDKGSDISTGRYKNHPVKSQSSYSRITSSSSSLSSSSSSSISVTGSEESGNYFDTQSQGSNVAKVKRSQSSKSSDSEGRPTNPLAKLEKHIFLPDSKHQSKKFEHISSPHSDDNNRKIKKLCDDDGDFKIISKSEDKRQAWDETKEKQGKKNGLKSVQPKEILNKSRPKTATVRSSRNSDKSKNLKFERASGHISDSSDITDVSPMDTPIGNTDGKVKHRREGSAKVTSSGDGYALEFRTVADSERKDDASDDDKDPDRTTGLDLESLMKAVGELEKQKRLHASSRRVIFAPATFKNIEKANYTFDKNQTRDIERENHRLLRELIRHLNANEQRKPAFRRPNYYKLTPSALNREREIQRIESENLAFLSRLQKVKPTRSICREHQLRDYENTTFHGVPIAALHPLPQVRRPRSCMLDDSSSIIGGRTRSVSSITSIGSSVRSHGSERNSRPCSASRQYGSGRKIIDNRPAWSDRW